LCVLFSASAWAEPNEADRATARALALDGHNALAKKEYATAIDRFARADALVHAPTLVVDWARALIGAGRLVEAHEKYELVLREGVDTNTAPKSWLRALDDAKKELDQLKPRLAWVTVNLRSPLDAQVKLSGVVVPPAAVGVRRAADPGFPEVEVTAPGYKPYKETLTIGPGEEKSIDVTLEEQPVAEAPLPTTVAVEPHKPASGRKLATYIAFTAGGVGIAAGGVTAGMALYKRGQLKDVCRDGTCPSSAQKKIDRYHLYGTISGVSLAVGVAGLGTGLVLLLTQPKDDASRDHAAVRPLLGLGFVGAEGSF
jgi:hypothetical protein